MGLDSWALSWAKRAQSGLGLMVQSCCGTAWLLELIPAGFLSLCPADRSHAQRDSLWCQTLLASIWWWVRASKERSDYVVILVGVECLLASCSGFVGRTKDGYWDKHRSHDKSNNQRATEGREEKEKLLPHEQACVQTYASAARLTWDGLGSWRLKNACIGEAGLALGTASSIWTISKKTNTHLHRDGKWCLGQKCCV